MSRDGEAGVTLVEVLVVLVLVGLMAGAVGLRLGDRPSDSAEQREATRLAVRLSLAADTALTTGEAATFTWGPDGYSLGDGPLRRTSAPILTAPGQYPISPDLLPARSGPLRLTLGDTTVVFDGARAFVVPGAL